MSALQEIKAAAGQPVFFSVEPHEGEWLHKLHMAGKWYGVTASSQDRTQRVEESLRLFAGLL